MKLYPLQETKLTVSIENNNTHFGGNSQTPERRYSLTYRHPPNRFEYN